MTNRIYNKQPKSDTLYWFSASIKAEDVLSVEIKKSVDTVLGNLCDALILKTKSETSTFFYSKSYLLDSMKFKEHHYGNWSVLATMVGALPLKIIIDNNQFCMESVAVEIKQEVLGKDFFRISPGIPIKQSGF